MSNNNSNVEPIIHIPSIVIEAEQNVIEDITNFDGTVQAATDLYENILFFIEMRQTTLPNLKTFLINKTDLYIMNGMHAEINYDVVVIPNSLHFFRIIAVPFGVCNISTEALDREIFNDLKETIKQTYTNRQFARRPVHKISHVLKTVQTKLFEINNRAIESKNKTSYNVEFKKYAHISPKISEFRVGDKMINKEFFTKLIIVNGKLLYEEHIYIASINNTHFENRINLLDYLMPINIEHVHINEKDEWRLTYSMQDVIDLLHKNNIKRAVYIDLSCSNNAQNNTQTIMNKTEIIEGHPYISVGNSHKSRNKNIVFSHQYRPRRTYKRTKSKPKTKSSF